MAKNLVIVESPAKAKTIERYLGKDYRVTASMGHVRDLPQKNLGVEIEKDFEPTYTILPGKKKVMDGLKKLAAGAKTVFMATDLDREGEAIAWHLCEALKLNPKTVQRVVFNEITKSAIQEAFAHPGRINMNKVAAQEARRILDRLVGYKLSPLLWKTVAWGLSAGRVQSVAVRLVVEREREIRAFKTEEYWTIVATLNRPNETRTFKALLAKVNDTPFRPSHVKDAKGIGDQLRKAKYCVLDVRTKMLEDKAPPPFITSDLQRAASMALGFSTKKTMTLAQHLYQGVELGSEGPVALITYMRTDSYHVAPAALTAVRELIQNQFGPNYLPPEPFFYRSKGGAQEAHEAIRPTDVTRSPDAVNPHLERDAARLYELIWRRFVASQMLPAIWNVTDVDINADAGTTRGLFKTRGRVLLFDGHTRVTGVRLGADEQELPALGKGNLLHLKMLEEIQHFTEPPARYNEATLVKKLESLGIGRPSTYAAIISTIQERGYVKQEKNLFLRCENAPACPYTIPCNLHGKPMWPVADHEKISAHCTGSLILKEGKRCFFATDLGETVTDKLVQHFAKIMDYAFTGHMEEELDEVEEAKMPSIQVIREFWEPFSAALEQAGEEMESTKNQAVEDAGPCPECGAHLVKRFSKHGPFLGCSKYPDCKYTRPTEGEARPQPKPTDHKCEKCGGAMLLRTSRRGESFLGCEKYPECKSTLPCDKDGNPIKPEVTGEVCEKCGAPMVIKRGRRGPFLACSAYPKCRNAKSLGGRKKKEGEPAADDSGEAPARRTPHRPRSKPVLTDRDCPDCGAKLVLRTGRRGPFLGCSTYPKCRHTEDAPADLKAAEEP